MSHNWIEIKVSCPKAKSTYECLNCGMQKDITKDNLSYYYAGNDNTTINYIDSCGEMLLKHVLA